MEKAKSVLPLIFIALISTVLLINCSGFSTHPQDPYFLTPFPAATLTAFDFDAPVVNQTQAVIAARLSLDTTRIQFSETPAVIFAEKTTVLNANQQIGVSIKGAENNEAIIWLVLFKGNYNIIPPGPMSPNTPPPPKLGCVYVLLEPEGGGGTQVATTPCPP